jgi:hypothetical protein
MADPLATIDAWGSPSASVSAFPAVGNSTEDVHQVAEDQNGKKATHDEDDDDDAPLSTSLRHREENSIDARPAPAQRTQSSAQRNQQPFLKVRITGLERNRKDLLIRFDANVSCRYTVDFCTELIAMKRPIFPTFGQTCIAICNDLT